MILSDILRFVLVYIVFLFGFSAAIVSLLIDPVNPRGKSLFRTIEGNHSCVEPTYKDFPYTVLELFKFALGIGDVEFIQDHKYKEVFYLLLIGYIILSYVLLLNMLIALMNRTVEKIALQTTSIWKLQRAMTILDMEKRLPCCLKKKYHCGEDRKLCTALGDDRRRCFRVEEVNWNKWNSNLVKIQINEDPGWYDRERDPGTPPSRGRSWRVLFHDKSWQSYESTEMRPV